MANDGAVEIFLHTNHKVLNLKSPYKDRYGVSTHKSALKSPTASADFSAKVWRVRLPTSMLSLPKTQATPVSQVMKSVKTKISLVSLS
jgi:DNA-directed RNA polymerase